MEFYEKQKKVKVKLHPKVSRCDIPVQYSTVQYSTDGGVMVMVMESISRAQSQVWRV